MSKKGNPIDEKAEKSLGKKSTGIWYRPRGVLVHPGTKPALAPFQSLRSSICTVERKTQRVWPAERLAR